MLWRGNSPSILTSRLNNVYSFLREIDSITFDTQGNFTYVKHEDYIYGLSKFNRRYLNIFFHEPIIVIEISNTYLGLHNDNRF